MCLKLTLAASIIIILCIVFWAGLASAESTSGTFDEYLNRQLGTLDTSGVEDFLQALNRDISTRAPEISFRGIIDGLLNRGGGYDFRGLWRALASFFMSELLANYRLLAYLIFLAILGALLENVQSSFGKEGIALLAKSTVFLVLVLIAIGSFSLSFSLAKETVGRITTFMKAALPSIVAVLASAGAPTTAALLHPLMLTAVYVVTMLVSDYVLTFLYLAAVLDLVSHVAGGLRISGLSGLLRQASVAVLGLCLSSFLGVMVIQRAAGSVADGIALRTAKFVSGTFIPVVGKMLSDTVEMLFTSSQILKSALGVVGIVAIIVAVAFPIAKMVCLILTYRVAAAITQPLGNDDITSCLQGIANTLTLVAVSMGAISLMFVVMLAMVALATRPLT